jgi:hypothetical protein
MGQLIESWAAFYANHAAIKTIVEFAHIGGLVAGGGCAIAADLATIKAGRGDALMRTVQLQLLKRTHVLAAAGLAALVVSGAALLAADLDTFLHSKIFWLKMGLMVLLLANGWLVLLREGSAKRGEPNAWARLHTAAVTSLALWFLTTLAGAALPNLG